MRYAALFLALMLAACGRSGFHMTDISGAMPRLDFHMTRASDGAAVTRRELSRQGGGCSISATPIAPMSARPPWPI